MTLRHAIVGSGIAALSAAEAIREARPKDEIVILSEEPHPFYSRPGLAYLLRNDIPERQLHIRTPADLRSLAAQRIHATVQRIDLGQKAIQLSTGETIPYDRLLLATGALAVPPTFPGGDLRGVVKLDGLDDARKILRLAKRGEPAVVVGGGITALELAEGLAARKMRVHFFLRGARYWSDILDESESAIVMDRLRHEGIILHTGTQIREAVGDRGRLVAVHTQAGARVPCRVLAVAIGVRPRIELARAAGLRVNKGILVDEYLRTSAPHVYAAGDAAEMVDSRTGATRLDILWPIALAQGRIAGANMAGANRAYEKATPHNVTLLAGLRVSIIGAVGGGKNDDLAAVSRGESERWRRDDLAGRTSGLGGVDRVRVVVGERTLLGALVMGDQTPARFLRPLVANQTDIRSVRDTVLAGGAEALHVLEKIAAASAESSRS